MEQVLRIRAVGHLHLEVTVGIVDAAYERAVREHRRHSGWRTATKSESHVPRAVRFPNLVHLPIENFLAPRDDADRIADALGIVHDVRAEDDRLPALLE